MIFSHASGYLFLTSTFHRFLYRLCAPGWIGVDLFFALSGFLITGILVDTRGAENYFSAFYARRALRIFPLYYLVLTVLVMAAHLYGNSRLRLPSAHDEIFYFVYLNNWWPLLHGVWGTNIIGHFWSLAVEEQFYLLWSVCIFFIRPRHIPRMCLSGFLLSAVLRCVVYLHNPNSRSIVENTFCQMDSLLIGSLVAVTIRNRKMLVERKRPIYLLGICAIAPLLFILGISSLWWVLLASHSLLALAFGALILRVYETDENDTCLQRLLTNRQLRSVGRYSYGMYVYHVPLLWALSVVFRRLGVAHWVLLTVATLLLTYLIAKLSFDLFESRFLLLKRHFRAY